MASSVMLRNVALVRTYVSEELSASFIRVTRIVQLGTTLAVTSSRRTLREPHSVTSQKTLCYKLEGHGSDSWCHWILPFT
jgi:hypothetical protein